MNTAVVLLGAITTAGDRGQHGHMGRSHGDVGDDQKESSCELHWCCVGWKGVRFLLFVEWVGVVMREEAEESLMRMSYWYRKRKCEAVRKGREEGVQ